jgi:prolyl-tRNA editing enzyme YbaK/EbsC (Cys-tRNA(Pro) deacylase)
VLVDRQVLVHDHVWIGAGSPRHMARVAPADLVRLAKAEPMDAVQDAA